MAVISFKIFGIQSNVIVKDSRFVGKALLRISEGFAPTNVVLENDQFLRPDKLPSNYETPGGIIR